MKTNTILMFRMALEATGNARHKEVLDLKLKVIEKPRLLTKGICWN